MSDAVVWVEKADGERIAFWGDCPIGRLPDNKVSLPDEKVSRHHALIQQREQGDYWLVDLGSSNGTYHNQRRIRVPVLLRDGDQIQVGDYGLVFRQLSGSAAQDWKDKTIQDVRWIETWLLVADIEGSSRLQQSRPLGEARDAIHAWMHRARAIVEKNNGVVNQFLGDGVFAYWVAGGDAHRHVIAAVADLCAQHPVDRIGFRLALHYGMVMTGGNVLGEDNLYGPNVHFVFRMEQLAKQLQQFCVVSDEAADRLEGVVRMTPVGRFTLPGFTVESGFHACSPPGDPPA